MAAASASAAPPHADAYRQMVPCKVHVDDDDMMLAHVNGLAAAEFMTLGPSGVTPKCAIAF